MGMRSALVVAVGVGRLATGLWFLAAPALPARTWVGSDDTAPRYLTRAVGGRDAAIGAGVLTAYVTRGPVWPWLAASVLSDATDALSSIPMLAPEHRKKALAYAGGFGTLGLLTCLVDTKA